MVDISERCVFHGNYDVWKYIFPDLPQTDKE